MDRLVWYRTWFRQLNEAKRRVFIAQRVRYADGRHGGVVHREWLLESPTQLQRMVRANLTPQIEVAAREVTPVCGDFFCFVLGISKNKLYQPTVPSPEFQTSVPRVSRGQNTEKPGKSFWLIMWLVNLAQFYLHDPTSERIILPFADKRAVYDMYIHECQDPATQRKWAPAGVPSRAWFYNAWQTDEGANHIKTRKTLRFSLCPECVAFMETRMHVLDDPERHKLKTAEAAHHKFVRKERGSYYRRRYEATSQPSTTFSIIIDGADQSAFGSPHHYLHSKDDDGHWKIGTHLMGALVHGRACHGFTMLPNIKHGSNVTIETLHRVLHHEFEKNNKKPFTQRVLNLQLDNTTKQCKSQYVLGYLALLVLWNVFSTVLLSFLLVGHTHEDIDQLFSRIATWLRKNNATSRIGFREAIVKSFGGKWANKTFAADIERAANVSDWLKDYLGPMGKKTQGPVIRDGITKFHQFKITMLHNVVIMRVREWCGDPDAPWSGLTPESTHHVVFPERIPTPMDLPRDCPPAQRSTKPTDEAYITKNNKGEIISNHTSKTRAGVLKLIENRKIDDAAKADLHACLELMESKEDLPFHWDMSMYTVHYATRGNAPPPMAAHAGDCPLDLGDESPESNLDDGPMLDDQKDTEVRRLDFDDAEPSSDEEAKPPDSEGYVPKPLLLNCVYLVRLAGTEWALAKYTLPNIDIQRTRVHHIQPHNLTLQTYTTSSCTLGTPL